jgi:hypothetical protein
MCSLSAVLTPPPLASVSRAVSGACCSPVRLLFYRLVDSGRRLATGTRAPLRLGFNTSAVTSTSQALNLTPAQRSLLVNKVIPDAQAMLQSLLSVDPVCVFVCHGSFAGSAGGRGRG